MVNGPYYFKISYNIIIVLLFDLYFYIHYPFIQVFSPTSWVVPLVTLGQHDHVLTATNEYKPQYFLLTGYFMYNLYFLKFYPNPQLRADRSKSDLLPLSLTKHDHRPETEI